MGPEVVIAASGATTDHNADIIVSWGFVMWSRHCKQFEDRAPVDEIYGCPTFKWLQCI